MSAVAIGPELDVEPVLAALRDRELVALYLIGSGALGDWNPETSDVDLVAVVERPLDRAAKEALVEELARPPLRLELVVYARGARPGEFDLNLNSGPEGVKLATFGSGEDSPHWFLIDASIAEQHARTIVGPPWSELFEPVPEAAVREALVQGLDWASREEPARRDTVRNALRAIRWAQEGVWSSKPVAVEWARGRGLNLRFLAGPEPLDVRVVATWLVEARTALS